MMLRAFKNAYV